MDVPSPNLNVLTLLKSSLPLVDLPSRTQSWVLPSRGPRLLRPDPRWRKVSWRFVAMGTGYFSSHCPVDVRWAPAPRVSPLKPPLGCGSHPPPGSSPLCQLLSLKAQTDKQGPSLNCPGQFVLSGSEALVPVQLHLRTIQIPAGYAVESGRAISRSSGI